MKAHSRMANRGSELTRSRWSIAVSRRASSCVRGLTAVHRWRPAQVQRLASSCVHAYRRGTPTNGNSISCLWVKLQNYIRLDRHLAGVAGQTILSHTGRLPVWLTSGVPRNFVRGGVNKFSWGQRERGSGGSSPLVRGSGGSCNFV